MEKMPVIGITSAYIQHSLNSEGVYIHHDYHRAVLEAGGIPIILPATADESAALSYLGLCDGFILSGGEDIDPVFFGEAPIPEMGSIFKERDIMELFLTKKLIEFKVPFLAVCRGIQVLNVACGGSLYQDIPAQLPSAAEHNQKTHRSNAFHTISIAETSLLQNILGVTEPAVNSLHHQAVKELGTGLIKTAVSKDSLIEAIEVEGHPFGIGVQWHPESLAAAGDLPSKSLFSALVRASVKKVIVPDGKISS